MSPFIRPRPTSLRTARTSRRRSRHDGRGRGPSADNRSARGPLTLEQLEGRQVLAAFVASETYVVNTLADAGPGSLRQAIILANAHKGADAIDFSVAGTIALRSALPAVTGPLELDGSSAPGYAGKPVVTLDFQNNAGLVVSAGADGSVIQSLSLVDSSGAGVSLAASGVTVAGNYIGLQADGVTTESNRGDGVAILAGSHDNMIGNGDSTSSFQLSNVISGNRGNGVSITWIFRPINLGSASGCPIPSRSATARFMTLKPNSVCAISRPRNLRRIFTLFP